jgi:hypothetical protein
MHEARLPLPRTAAGRSGSVGLITANLDFSSTQLTSRNIESMARIRELIIQGSFALNYSTTRSFRIT